MFLDPTYIGIIVIIGIISSIASLMVKIKFSSASKVLLSANISGEDIAKRILKENQIYDVVVKEGHGFLTDHYNPMTKELVLSKDVFHGKNAAACGVAAHEVGHAIQHARGYFPLWLRSILVPITNIGSNLGLWLTIIGIALGSASEASRNVYGTASIVAIIGIALFSTAFIFSLVTVPVEINASNRAIRTLEDMSLIRDTKEKSAVKAVLRAAAMTYIAAAISALLQLLYWIAKSGLLNRRD